MCQSNDGLELSCFNNFAKKCLEALLCRRRLRRVTYESDHLTQWEENEIEGSNHCLFSSLENSGNLYAIWIRLNCCDDWTLKYVGKSEANRLKNRVKQHLVSKPNNTKSKLEKVKEAVRAGKHIGISWILVQPETLNASVESYIISQKDPCWNERRS